MRRHHPLPALLPLLLALAFATPLTAQHWAQVSVGDDHVCALDTEGRAYCFGNNHSGQLGARTPEHCGIVGESGHRACHPTASGATPLRAAGGRRFITVSAGRYVTCGLDVEGRAFCWGQPLGPDSAYRERCLDSPCSFDPVPLEPARRFGGIDMTARCAVELGGTALCWGGDFRTAARFVTPWPDVKVMDVDGDAETSTRCARAEDGRVYCRGRAEFGLLGNGSRDSAATGAAVDHPGRLWDVAVMGAWAWACGLDNDGAALCWGAAGYDDAARDTTERPGFERCDRWGTVTWCNTRPAPVEGGLVFHSVTAMPRGTLPTVYEMVGLTPQLEAYVWDGRRQPRPWHPERRWISLAADDWGQCGVTTDGELFCWGRDPHEEVQGLIPHPN